jgi:hypothetical protein
MGGEDGTLPEDGGPTGKAKGEPCLSGDDCASGLCGWGRDGRACVDACPDAPCPAGEVCANTDPLDAASPEACVDHYSSLCAPCASDADCGPAPNSLCVAAPGGVGAFCASACVLGDQCPEGFQCSGAESVGGEVKAVCVPTAEESCSCSPWAAYVGTVTDCLVTNDSGSCGGTRGCGDTGLTACDAPVPAEDGCNGVDDDCDGITDEAVPGLPCGITNTFGTCPGLTACQAGQIICAGDDPTLDFCDGADNDCDGVTDEDHPDLDADGQADCVDEDDDGDGVLDVDDNCPLASNVTQDNLDGDEFGDICDDDVDGDGTANIADNCTLTANADQLDTDGDGTGDACDDDDDDDGILDADDNCPLAQNVTQDDFDGDDIGDICDDDIDGDGVANLADNCTLVTNGGQADLDGDQLGDACDDDLDGDSVQNDQDNCPVASNVTQTNLDGDKFGDACDGDIDGDGAINGEDCGPEDADVYPGAPELCNNINDDCDGETDEDIAPEPCDITNEFGTCPGTTSCEAGGVELCNGVAASEEVCDGIDNNCEAGADEGFPNTDDDDEADCVDDDDDGDGALDDDDNCPKAFNQTQNDTDKDGQGDACDIDDDDDNILDDDDNCPLVSNPQQLDLDKDNVGNACDNDLDGDGVFNNDDCKPLDANIYGGKVEVCDGIDDNCDNVVDDGCDEDGDDFCSDARDIVGSPAVCPNDAGKPKGSDCFDGNGDVFPGQAQYFTTPYGNGSFDYNCDGNPQKQWNGTNSCGGFSCGGNPGWIGGVPDCGKPGSYSTACTGFFFVCNDNDENRTQACR